MVDSDNERLEECQQKLKKLKHNRQVIKTLNIITELCLFAVLIIFLI